MLFYSRLTIDFYPLLDVQSIIRSSRSCRLSFNSFCLCLLLFIMNMLYNWSTHLIWQFPSSSSSSTFSCLIYIITCCSSSGWNGTFCMLCSQVLYFSLPSGRHTHPCGFRGSTTHRSQSERRLVGVFLGRRHERESHLGRRREGCLRASTYRSVNQTLRWTWKEAWSIKAWSSFNLSNTADSTIVGKSLQAKTH